VRLKERGASRRAEGFPVSAEKGTALKEDTGGHCWRCGEGEPMSSQGFFRRVRMMKGGAG